MNSVAGGFYPQRTEHADDLAPVQRAVIHHVHNDLPGGKAGVTDEAGFEGHLPGNVGVGGCFGLGFPLGLQARPLLNDEVEGGKRPTRFRAAPDVDKRD